MARLAATCGVGLDPIMKPARFLRASLLAFDGQSIRMIRIGAFIAILALFFLVHCRTASAQENVLHFVTWKPEAAGVWDQAVADFERANPGVKVIREVAPQSSTQIHDLLVRKIQKPRRAARCLFYGCGLARRVCVGGLGVAARVATSPPPSKKSFCRRRSRRIAIAAKFSACRYSSTPVCFITGKDLLEKYTIAPPQTWNQLLQAAKTILAREQDRQLVGFSGQFKQYEGLVCNMMEYILSNGGALWDEKRMTSTLDQPAALEAVRSCAIISSARSPGAACSPMKNRNRSRFSLKGGRFSIATGRTPGRFQRPGRLESRRAGRHVAATGLRGRKQCRRHSAAGD